MSKLHKSKLKQKLDNTRLLNIDNPSTYPDDDLTGYGINNHQTMVGNLYINAIALGIPHTLLDQFTTKANLYVYISLIVLIPFCALCILDTSSQAYTSGTLFYSPTESYFTMTHKSYMQTYVMVVEANHVDEQDRQILEDARWSIRGCIMGTIVHKRTLDLFHIHCICDSNSGHLLYPPGLLEWLYQYNYLVVLISSIENLLPEDYLAIEYADSVAAGTVNLIMDMTEAIHI